VVLPNWLNSHDCIRLLTRSSINPIPNLCVFACVFWFQRDEEDDPVPADDAGTGALGSIVADGDADADMGRPAVAPRPRKPSKRAKKRARKAAKADEVEVEVDPLSELASAAATLPSDRSRRRRRREGKKEKPQALDLRLGMPTSVRQELERVAPPAAPVDRNAMVDDLIDLPFFPGGNAAPAPGGFVFERTQPLT
jgi:hypothetical protein